MREHKLNGPIRIVYRGLIYSPRHLLIVLMKGTSYGSQEEQGQSYVSGGVGGSGVLEGREGCPCGCYGQERGSADAGTQSSDEGETEQ